MLTFTKCQLAPVCLWSFKLNFQARTLQIRWLMHLLDSSLATLPSQNMSDLWPIEEIMKHIEWFYHKKLYSRKACLLTCVISCVLLFRDFYFIVGHFVVQIRLYCQYIPCGLLVTIIIIRQQINLFQLKGYLYLVIVCMGFASSVEHWARSVIWRSPQTKSQSLLLKKNVTLHLKYKMMYHFI